MAEERVGSSGESESFLVERKESGLVTVLSIGLGSIITLIAITWAVDLWLELGFTWFDEQAMIACVGLALGIIFIRMPATGESVREKLPWYDAILALLGMGIAGYFIISYDEIAYNPFAMRPTAFTIGLVIVPLVWEALRRTAGWSLTLVFSVFLAYAFIGHLMPGMLKGIEQNNVDIIAFLGTSEVALIGLPLKIIVLTVVLFIWMGQLLLYTGASEWFTDFSAALMGRSRGGSAKIAVVASGLFGSISGSAVSNVASTGVITIPLMRQAGYDAKTAGAIEAVASTGGQIMPPIMGAAAFLMAEILELAYTEIILAALIPSALYYLAVFVQADLEAAKNGVAPLPKDRIPPLLRVLREGWFFSIPYVVLIYTLFWMNMAPQKAAFWASVSVGVVSVIFGYRKMRISPKQLWDSITGCGRLSVDIVIIGAMAGIIIGILDKTGLGQALTLILAAVGENNLWLLLILTAFISILLGMGDRSAYVRAVLRADVDDHAAGGNRGVRGGVARRLEAHGNRHDRRATGMDRLHHPLRFRAVAEPADAGRNDRGADRLRHGGDRRVDRILRLHRLPLSAYGNGHPDRVHRFRDSAAAAGARDTPRHHHQCRRWHGGLPAGRPRVHGAARRSGAHADGVDVREFKTEPIRVSHRSVSVPDR
jgi:TRAP transporter 4TM/12TM fusion protein